MVVSGSRFESFLFLFFGLHVRARESEGTACVVVSGSFFVSGLKVLFFFLHIRPRTYGHVLVATKYNIKSENEESSTSISGGQEAVGDLK